MSDKAFCSSSATILPDSIKTKLKGSLDFNIVTQLASASGDGWIYAEPTITYSNADVLGTTEDYLGPVTGAGAVATGDKIKWMVIKHTGTSNGSSVTGVGVIMDLNAATCSSTHKGILLGPGEMIVLKCPNTTVADFHAITVNMLNGIPTSTATVAGEDVRLIVAGILNNVA